MSHLAFEAEIPALANMMPAAPARPTSTGT